MLFNDQSEKEHAEQAYGSTEEAESRTLFGFFFDCGKGGQGMFLLFFLLWLLLSGGVDLHICLWGLAVSALLTGFCKRVLGYDWRPFFGSPARIWALARYFLHLLLEMLKAGLIIMKIIYTHPKEISPKLVWFRTPLRTDRHRAMLSDSITLTAATDPDGTVESYRYERQVDGGGWTQFADVDSLTQTDAVSSDWGTVAYRACAVDDAGEAGPYATSETYDVNSGWVVISGPDEDMGSKPQPFIFTFSASCTGPSAASTGISAQAALDGKQLYTGTVNAGQQVNVVIDTRGLSAGEHTVEAQASKEEYLPASKSYDFTVPGLTLPNAVVGDWIQNPSGQTVCPPTLGRVVICRNGKDANAEFDALEARIAALEN